MREEVYLFRVFMTVASLLAFTVTGICCLDLAGLASSQTLNGVAATLAGCLSSFAGQLVRSNGGMSKGGV
jgi:hypothetical protein